MFTNSEQFEWTPHHFGSIFPPHFHSSCSSNKEVGPHRTTAPSQLIKHHAPSLPFKTCDGRGMAGRLKMWKFLEQFDISNGYIHNALDWIIFITETLDSREFLSVDNVTFQCVLLMLPGQVNKPLPWHYANKSIFITLLISTSVSLYMYTSSLFTFVVFTMWSCC